MKKITVLLSEDHAIVRQGLRLLLEAAEDIEVIGEAENGQRAVGEAIRLQPDELGVGGGIPHGQPRPGKHGSPAYD